MTESGLWGKTGNLDFLTEFVYAKFSYPNSRSSFWVFDLLICVNKMASKLPFLGTVHGTDI